MAFRSGQGRVLPLFNGAALRRGRSRWSFLRWSLRGLVHSDATTQTPHRGSVKETDHVASGGGEERAKGRQQERAK
jgi:hypothetical protein